MKALTLTQPWATLVAIGAKRVETRSWGTRYRGPLAIHAAKSFPLEARALLREPEFEGALRGRTPLHRDWAAYPRGEVVATCSLVDVLPIRNEEDGPKAGERFVAVDDQGHVRVWSGGKIGQQRLEVWSGDGLHAAEHESVFGDYSLGRFAWLLEDVEVFPEPVAAKGALGLWEWTPANLAQEGP